MGGVVPGAELTLVQTLANKSPGPLGEHAGEAVHGSGRHELRWGYGYLVRGLVPAWGDSYRLKSRSRNMVPMLRGRTTRPTGAPTHTLEAAKSRDDEMRAAIEAKKGFT